MDGLFTRIEWIEFGRGVYLISIAIVENSAMGQTVYHVHIELTW